MRKKTRSASKGVRGNKSAATARQKDPLHDDNNDSEDDLIARVTTVHNEKEQLDDLKTHSGASDKKEERNNQIESEMPKEDAHRQKNYESSGGGCGKGNSKRVALLQTLLFLSFAALQNKLTTADPTAAAEAAAAAAAVSEPYTTAWNQAGVSTDRKEQEQDEPLDAFILNEAKEHLDDVADYQHGLEHLTPGWNEYTDSTWKENTHEKPSSSHSKQQENQAVIVVTCVDGTIAGLSRATGETLWIRSPQAHMQAPQGTHPPTFTRNEAGRANVVKPKTPTKREAEPERQDSASHQISAAAAAAASASFSPPSLHNSNIFEPLVATTTTIASASQNPWRIVAVPSIDGTVYLTSAASPTTNSKDPEEDESAELEAQNRRFPFKASGQRPSGGGASGNANTPYDVTVTTTARDLVGRAPFFDPHGRLYTGARYTTAVALDGDTGEVLQVLSTPKLPPRNDKHQGAPPLEGRNVVWMGRVTYTVSIHEPNSLDLDVAFSTAEIMSVQDMVLGAHEAGHQRPQQDTAAAAAAASWNIPQHSQGSSPFAADDDNGEDDDKAEEDVLFLVATPDGHVALQNAATGSMTWVAKEAFGTPVAFALDSVTGESVPVELVPDAVLPHGTVDYVESEMQRQLQLSSGRRQHFQQQQQFQQEQGPWNHNQQQPHQQYRTASPLDGDHGFASGNPAYTPDEETIVGSMANGQLFAMPLGPRLSSTSSSSSSSSSWTSSSSGHALAASSAAMRPPHDELKAAGAGSSGLLPHPQAQFWPDGTSSGRTGGGAATTGGSTKCTQGNPHFPTCLLGTSESQRKFHAAGGLHHHHHAAGDVSNFLSSWDPAALHQHLQYHQRHEEDPYAVVPFFDRMGTLQHAIWDGRHHGRRRENKILRILGSWLPPTLALIFVVSFELGRRRRQKEMDLVANNNSNNTCSDLTRTEEELVQIDGKLTQVTNVGVIQVLDDFILGYGGHGTVVFKGMLDGRQVAVKRMLKAYHASADREISLLIESDGHPNVVRYFLKEARGDFVYLALELCDLSLHDMIGTLRSAFEGGGSNGIDDGSAVAATKTILFQIATGVRHLHQLRICHRDLKPANILLAESMKGRKSRSVDNAVKSPLDIFLAGQYVAKISDMGLAKSIVGQSSFGVSVLNEASLRGQSNGGQSSIVGAGPGSVGWQAPEVMAMRLPSSDTSVRSSDGGSQGPQDSPYDMSPAEITAATRTSRSADVFSLGCIFFSALLPGRHPFGEWYEREANIMHYRPSMSPLEKVSPEAFDLISGMIQRNPTARPTASQICDHVLFWSAARRLSFLCDFSDRIENDGMSIEGGEVSASFMSKVLAVERNAAQVVGISWDRVLDADLLKNIQRFRSYDCNSLRDLLRLIRNKHHHFDELPVTLKETIGSNTEGLMNYFDERFPSLVIHCATVCRDFWGPEDPLCIKYNLTPMGRARRVDGQASSTQEEKKDLSVDYVDEITGSNDPLDLLVQKADAKNVSIQRADENEAEASGVEATSDQSDRMMVVDNDETQEKNCEPSVELVAAEDGRETHDSLSPDPVVVEESATLPPGDLVVWHGSAAAKAFNCRGWNRSDDEWERCVDTSLKKRDSNLLRCVDDPKFRTRLCNHWDASHGTFCPMRKKNKCVFAHGPVELRVKEAKRNRWGKLVDQNGDNKNPCHSGGEDTYGAARSIESERKQEGKWNTDKAPQAKGRKQTQAKKS